jgi:hypothetical protein
MMPAAVPRSQWGCPTNRWRISDPPAAHAAADGCDVLVISGSMLIALLFAAAFT